MEIHNALSKKRSILPDVHILRAIYNGNSPDKPVVCRNGGARSQGSILNVRKQFFEVASFFESGLYVSLQMAHIGYC